MLARYLTALLAVVTIIVIFLTKMSKTKMPTLTIRNVATSVHKFLRKQAAEHGRSMEAEVREILKQDMKNKQDKPSDIARQIHTIFAKIGGGDDLADALPQRDKQAPDPVTFK